MDAMTIVLCFESAIITWVVTYVACKCIHRTEVYWLRERNGRQSQEIVRLRHQIVSERCRQEGEADAADWWKPAGWKLEGEGE